MAKSVLYFVIPNKNFATWNKGITRYLSTSSHKNSSRIDLCGHELEAVKDIPHGAKVLIGGFGSCGVPENLINGLIQKNSKNLTVVSNNAGTDTYGVGLLLKNRQIKRLILSFTGPNKEYDRQFANGELEVELIPQGTLIEKLRAGGAGIPAFYTRTGYGTMIQLGGLPIKFENDRKTVSLVSESREHRRFDIGDCILEKSIVGDFSLIKAWKADRDGNLTFRKTARNFNIAMCHAAKTTIVEVDEIVDVGQLDPESVHVPGVYVDRIVKSSGHQQCLIPNRQASKAGAATVGEGANDVKFQIARRAAEELKDGMYVNLGIGIPLLCAQFIPKDVRVFLHGENGLVGVGPYPDVDQVDPDIVNAGGENVTIVPGGAYQTSEESFAMIRGGHLHLTILGAYQVSQFGDLASWMIPGKAMRGMGGAMDLVGAPNSRVVVTMEHTSRGVHKILPSCTLPLTGKGVVDTIITEKCVFNVDKREGLILTELADGVSLEDVANSTGCPFQVQDDVRRKTSVM